MLIDLKLREAHSNDNNGFILKNDITSNGNRDLTVNESVLTFNYPPCSRSENCIGSEYFYKMELCYLTKYFSRY